MTTLTLAIVSAAVIGADYVRLHGQAPARPLPLARWGLIAAATLTLWSAIEELWIVPLALAAWALNIGIVLGVLRLMLAAQTLAASNQARREREGAADE